MNKDEFLLILRRSLTGEVQPAVIEENIRYYEQYINGSASEQEERLERLGDPRLIAKTIIETDKAAKDKYRYNSNNQSYNGQYQEAEYEGGERRSKVGRDTSFFSNTTWKQKLTIGIMLVILILFVIIIGRLLIGLLVAFGIPIILLLLVWYLFRKRQ